MKVIDPPESLSVENPECDQCNLLFDIIGNINELIHRVETLEDHKPTDLGEAVQKSIQLLRSFPETDGTHHAHWIVQESLRLLKGMGKTEFDAYLDDIGWEKGIPG